MAKEQTIWQGLSSILTPNIDSQKIINYVPNKRDILKQQLSATDAKIRNLEQQQTKYLQDTWIKNSNYTSQRELETSYGGRLIAYQDYEAMEFYPIISSALTLMAEEATLANDEGNVLGIESNNDRIKKELENLFYDVIDINTNLYFWTRQTIKYGDNFVYVMGLPNKGVLNVRQQPPIQIERQEKEVDGKFILNFRRNDTNTDFNVFQMLHFRLLEDDKFLPYGSSVLNKVRRTFRQLIMAEDAMLVYRIERASERRVFKIDVGNIDDKDVKPYIDRIATSFKKRPSVDRDSANIDFRYNSLTVSEDYFIPVRNGNNSSVIDTLPGASNLDQISDIEYLRDNLFTGLSIPKPLLSFDESTGDGKSLSMMDIRLAKKINRIQKCIIGELNKLAITHLYLKGFEDEDILDFKLTMTNPSPQLDLLKIEVLNQKADIYDKLVKNENGIAIMSHTKAKQQIFGWSADEIKLDLEQQKYEKMIANEILLLAEDEELKKRKSGLFIDFDKRHGIEDKPAEEEGGDEATDDVGGDMGGDEGDAPDLGGDEELSLD